MPNEDGGQLCLLLEINQLFKIKLMQEGWTEVLYFAEKLLFNFHFSSFLVCALTLQN